MNGKSDQNSSLQVTLSEAVNTFFRRKKKSGCPNLTIGDLINSQGACCHRYSSIRTMEYLKFLPYYALQCF